MRPEDRIRISHILEAAREATEFCRGRSSGELESNRMLLLAVVRCIEVIGEAAGTVSPELRESAPEIPWKSMIAMRNRLIHGYFDVDPAIVWKTVREELPPLLQQLGKMAGL